MDSELDTVEEVEEMIEVADDADEPLYTDDEGLDEDIDITAELYDADAENTPRDTVEPAKHKVNNKTRLVRAVDDVDGDNDKVEVGAHKMEDGVNDIKLGSFINYKNITDAVDESTVALMRFSDDLAESIVEQAMLISDIYTKDKLNGITRPAGGNRDRANIGSRTLGRSLPSAVTDENGCDRYLLDKLLRSQPDAEESPPAEYEGFSGEEVNFKSDLNVDGDGRIIDVVKDRLDVNDQNNNQMDANTISMLSDNYLETIHEDKELFIDHPEVDEADLIRRENSPNPDEKGQECIDDQANIESFLFDVTTATEKSEKEYHSEVSDEETDDEIDCCEMTTNEKRIIAEAVRQGDIDKVEIRLERRNADINMIWFGDNLLMLAIKAGQQKMAEFLIDNGIDLEYKGSIMELANDGVVTVVPYTARELAFDRDMDDIVEVIDSKTNNLFPFVKPKKREIRLRRPKPPTPLPTPEVDEEEDDFDEAGVEGRTSKNSKHSKNSQDHGHELNSETGSARPRSRQQDGGDPKLTNNKISRKERRATTASSSVSNKIGDETETVAKQPTATHSDVHSRITEEEDGDDISHVFGQDEGYETMSPVSPFAPAPPGHRFDRSLALGSKDYANIRETRSSYSMKSRNSAQRSRFRSESAVPPRTSSDSLRDDDMCPVQALGSYNRESRRWHQVKSAPVRHQDSVESIPDTAVRLGFPFVHGTRSRSTSASSTKNETPRQRTQSARGNLSPFSHVARLLAENRLLETNSPSSSASHGKHLPEVRTEPLVTRKDTRTSYTCIYANSTSSIPGRTIFSYPGTTLKSGHLSQPIKKIVRA